MEDKSLSQQVYEKIKEDIMSLKYSPGEYLTERELAQGLGVSRTPVREALQRLSQEYWVVIGEGKKIQVRPVTSVDVYEIIQIRNIIEYSAIDWCINKGEPRALAGHLDSILNKMKKSEDGYVFTKLDLDFHALIVSSMNNERLERFWKTVHEEVVRMGMMVLRDGNNRFSEVLKEHEKLVDALWNKDSTEVHGAMKFHLENSYAPLITFLETTNGIK